MWPILGWIAVIGLPLVVIITTVCWPERVSRRLSIDAARKGSSDASPPDWCRPIMEARGSSFHDGNGAE